MRKHRESFKCILRNIFLEKEKETSEAEKNWDLTVFLGLLDLVRFFFSGVLLGKSIGGVPTLSLVSGLKIAEKTSWLRIFLRLTYATSYWYEIYFIVLNIISFGSYYFMFKTIFFFLKIWYSTVLVFQQYAMAEASPFISNTCKTNTRVQNAKWSSK